jgi:response regulator RpfG family c-di-GMP phosphodiesterase
MKIIVIDDDSDVREAITLAIQGHMDADCLQACTAEEGIKLIDKSPDAEVIICDYSMPNGNGNLVFKHLLSTGQKTRFILCSGEVDRVLSQFKGPNFVGAIHKPRVIEPLLKLLQETLPISTLPEEQYCRIGLLNLQNLAQISCDLFLKLSESKYVRVLREGDTFSKDDIARYQQKQVTHFYVNRADFDRIIRLLEQDLESIYEAEQSSSSATFELSKGLLGMTQEMTSQFGVTEQSQKLIERNVSLALSFSAQEKTLSDFFDRFGATHASQEEFPFSHCILTAHVACIIATNLGLRSRIFQHKLAMAALLHDFALYPPKLANYRTLEELKNSNDWSLLDMNAVTIYNLHPENGANMVKKIKNIPAEVDTIILQHHEQPDGWGFPAGLRAPAINCLAAILIVAEDLVFERLRNNRSVEDFIRESAPRYSDEPFRSIVESISSCLNTSMKN